MGLFTEKMNSVVKEYLGEEKTREWSFLNNDIYESLSKDLLKSVAKRGNRTISTNIYYKLLYF